MTPRLPWPLPAPIRRQPIRDVLARSTTGLVEIASGAGFILRGLLILWYGYLSMPHDPQGIVVPWELSDRLWGGIHLLIGVLMLNLVGRRAGLGRVAVALFGATVMSRSIWSYWVVGVDYLGIMGLFYLLFLLNMFVSVRAATDWLAWRTIRDRRGRPTSASHVDVARPS